MEADTWEAGSTRAVETPEELARDVLSRGPAALITDVDGTISRIVEDPDSAEVEPAVVDILEELHSHLALVALLSGRSISQLRRMVRSGDLVYVGNHGLEWSQAGRTYLAAEVEGWQGLVTAALRQLRRELTIPGVIVEDKGISGAVHYRRCSDPARARSVILAAAARAARVHGFEVSEGRKVVNIVPPVAVNKGTAVERLVRDHGLRGVVYLGDDMTDLDAFRSLRKMARGGRCRVFLVGVFGPASPDDLQLEADLVLPTVAEAVNFLRQMTHLVATVSEVVTPGNAKQRNGE